MIKKIAHSKISNAEKIHELFQVSYSIEAQLIGVKDFPPLRRTLANYKESNTLFFGFWKDDDLAGAVEIDFLENTIHICSLVVDPKYFRQGIAYRLLEFVEDYDDSENISVETGLANLPAITLYKKFGFQEKMQLLTAEGIKKIGLIKSN